ncbi:MAG: excinuclease ABC subunit UvrC [Rickettsiales bacterium]
MSEDKTSLKKGREVIKSHLRTMPQSSGVYRMIDESGNSLYVGKAKNLKNRVMNYVNTVALNTRLQNMISQTAALEIVTTRSEAEALLLEANLIKKHSPKYNILLKDDKSFPYIFFSGNHDFPRISKYRGAKGKKGKYFGPFVSAGAVDEVITLLQKVFLLRSCSDNIFKNRTRPCLKYQIKRCCAPCVDYVSKEDYDELLNQAYDFLSGKSKRIKDELNEQMRQASELMDYEKAATLRDRIQSLTQVQQQNKLSSANIADADMVAIVRKDNNCCVTIFSFRGGANYGSKNYFPTNTKEHSDSEIITSFISQFYQSQSVPKLLLVSEELDNKELMEEALSLRADCHVEIINPKRGDKHELMKQAHINAKDALNRHIISNLSQKVVLEEVKKLFDLPDMPKRIEVYDNSHISGTNRVGAMIVAGEDGFIKNQYRKFDIKNSEVKNDEIRGGDDYAMLREVFIRRFSRLKEEAKDKPDLVLIDGGAGQLSVATEVFNELAINDIIYVAIAKGEDRNAGREHFFMPSKKPFQLPYESPVLHYLQRLRDEAHRFAIGAHRNKRSKSMKVSEIDSIDGIGAVRKKALLHYFGSTRAIAAASIEEIAKVEGISKDKAEDIYRYFHGR